MYLLYPPATSHEKRQTASSHPERTIDVLLVTVKLHAQQAERGRLVLQGITGKAPARRELGEFDLATLTHHTIHQELPAGLDLQGKRTLSPHTAD